MKAFLVSIVFAICALQATAGFAADRVDLEIVMALDASGSVDADEYRLQLGGVAAALRDPDVLAAIATGPNHQIGVNVLIWARPSDNKQTSGWRVIANAQDAEDFGAEVKALPRLQGGGTGIGSGIVASLFELRTSPFESSRRVIDVSGDGRESFNRLTSESGSENAPDLTEAHQMADKMGVIINGLAITGDDLDLFTYYLSKVIHGPASFAMPANDYADFARAMKEKLLREINSGPVALHETDSDHS